MAGLLLPMLLYRFQLECVQSSSVQLLCAEFTESVATKGYIEAEVYENFRKELDNSGVHLTVDIYVEHDALAPEYKLRTIQDSEEYLQGLFEGENVLKQDDVFTQHPVVVDPGTPSYGLLNENVSGADRTTKGPDDGHKHGATCYAGTQHWHDEECPGKKVRCSAGCSLHIHSGSPASGTGCYTGNYNEPQRTYCGSLGIESSTSSPSGMTCSNGHEMAYCCEVYVCSGCGARTSSSFYRCECWQDLHDYYSHYVYSGGGYSMSCTKSTSVYYKGNSICPACNGTGYVESTACTKTDGGYYDAEGALCLSLCGQVVTELKPIWKEQVITAGEEPNTEVKAVFADGHTEIVNGTLSGFRCDLCNVVQTVTLLYGKYKDSAVNAETSATTVLIMVLYPVQECEYGHSYYLVNGERTWCPYCRAYPEKITVLGAGTVPFCITKGSTLAENGILLKVTYLDGHTETIDKGWIDNLDLNYVGEQMVQIGYLGVKTTLQVKNECVKTQCYTCGYEYFLYPDNTDPGCPKCLADIPVFTGNVLRYTETKSFLDILSELYHGTGICCFSRGDRLVIRLWKNESSAAENILGVLSGTGYGKELFYMQRVKIRDEKPGR